MGQSNSAAELAGKFRALSRQVGQIPREATTETVREAKNVMLAQLAAAGVKGNRLRGVGKKGARLGVSYDVKTLGSGAASGIVRATGPWQFIEGDTKAHDIPRRGRRRPKVLAINGSFRRAVPHPGTQGKHPWRKGGVLMRTLGPRAYERGLERAVRKVF